MKTCFRVHTKLVFVVLEQKFNVVFCDQEVICVLWFVQDLLSENSEGSLGIFILNLGVNLPFQVEKLREALIDALLCHGRGVVSLLELGVWTRANEVDHSVDLGEAQGRHRSQVPGLVENLGPPMDQSHLLTQLQVLKTFILDAAKLNGLVEAAAGDILFALSLEGIDCVYRVGALSVHTEFNIQILNHLKVFSEIRRTLEVLVTKYSSWFVTL